MNTNPDICYHLTVESILKIHSEATSRFGGIDIVREMNLLESTVNSLHASFQDQLPSMDVVEMGGAYLFYMCRNRLFLDGNKRTALGACISFLKINGIQTESDSPEWERLVKAVDSHKLTRGEATHALRNLTLNNSTLSYPQELAAAC